MLSSGRHVVLGDIDGAHRIWLRDTVTGQGLAYVIVRDDAVALRLAAMKRFDRRTAGAPPARLPPGFQPTPFQRQRLSMLLDILDALLAGDREPATSYEIARRFIYPSMSMGRGTDWKTSSERRRTQRLIDEALALMRGEYRALLRG